VIGKASFENDFEVKASYAVDLRSVQHFAIDMKYASAMLGDTVFRNGFHHAFSLIL